MLQLINIGHRPRVQTHKTNSKLEVKQAYLQEHKDSNILSKGSPLVKPSETAKSSFFSPQNLNFILSDAFKAVSLYLVLLSVSEINI